MSENLENNNLLARWLSGEVSEEERQQLEGTAYLDELKAVVEDIDSWKLPTVDIERKLAEAKASKTEAPKTIVRSIRPMVMRIAAAVALIAVGFFVGREVLSPQMILVETGLAEQLTHELPDGSMVTLGPESRLEYSKKNWDDSRNLDLVGQGFFDVESGSTFRVTSVLGEVTVLGTEFDVYNAGSKLLVNCFEGRVQVSADGKTQILNAMEGVVFDGGKFTQKSLVEAIPSWISGTSHFDNAPLSEVVIELQRYFDVQITLTGQIRSMAFSGSFDHDNLEAALRNVFTPLEILYTLSADGKVVFQ